MSCGDTATVAVRSSTSAPGFLAVGRRCIRQRFSSGNCHPLRMTAQDVVIFVFLLSYMLTSSWSNSQAYPASTNLLVLRRLFLNPGTMCTSLAGCRMLNGSIFISSAGYSCPPAARNIRSDFWPVEMKGSGSIFYVPQVETSEGA